MQRRSAKKGGFGWRGMVFAVLVLAALCAAGWHARRPLTVALQQHQRAAQLREELNSEKRANKQLHRERDDLLTPGGRETKARGQGYLMPGEELINVPKGH